MLFQSNPESVLNCEQCEPDVDQPEDMIYNLSRNFIIGRYH